ncbi:uncharacterized protein MICPUCDRAFT_51001 [Micromonas pusilla CCMP1545]|uniref:Predicted protein n=1 Tax=Micromonas pusilla (strain CCMP1545) TaxID=564608 RepID=C1N0F6_MICPC|nr:uncharacterized protein MICPUCDRAFT_51001 [Micromonas pusilla CCMP1545]EEH54259.1 predicted protein [Micromonas pusilla CCMP1545]|eukprot:XP_003061629.1 predicted protein [Micromonas pusilla CCMP1545]
MAFAVGRRRALDVVSSAFASSARGLAATRVARRAAATTAAGRGDAGGDPDALCAQIVSYARSELRRGRRDVARGVLEHGASLVAKAAGGDAPAGAIAAAESRAHLAWAAVQSVRARSSSWLRRVVRCDAAREESNNTFYAIGPGGAEDLLPARANLDAHLDAVDAAAAEAIAEALGHVEDGERTRASMSLAARGVRALTALATGDAAAASRAVDDATALLLDDDDDASRLDAARAFDAPHGAVVAMALKTLAHWSALTGEGDGKSRGAIARYRRAAAAAEEAADAPSNDACVSAMFADALLADVQLARAQHLVRVAASGGDLEDEEEEEEGEERPRDEDAALAAAEAAAAAAVTSAEALGDPAHPRVGLAIACSGDVYVCKATAAARRGGGAGGGATGDGAGVLFAEGLYRGALKLLGTPRPPTALAHDPDAASGGAASAHLRLVASLVHARYSVILRASGANRRVLSHTGPRTTASARWTPILKDFCRRLSPPTTPRFQSRHTSTPFNST